jgi:hypothetical protein
MLIVAGYADLSLVCAGAALLGNSNRYPTHGTVSKYLGALGDALIFSATGSRTRACIPAVSRGRECNSH